MTHHPHLHMIVPGGGISLDGQRWIACRRPRFILPVRVLSKLFRRLMLEKLLAAHTAGKLQFFSNRAALTERKAFAARRWHGEAERSCGLGVDDPRSEKACEVIPLSLLALLRVGGG